MKFRRISNWLKFKMYINSLYDSILFIWYLNNYQILLSLLNPNIKKIYLYGSGAKKYFMSDKFDSIVERYRKKYNIKVFVLCQEE